MKILKKRGAFTLIELLVVVAIIAVLASLLLPTLSKAKTKARSLQCLMNLRNIGRILQLYASEHQDMLPPAIQTPEGTTVTGTGPWNPIFNYNYRFMTENPSYGWNFDLTLCPLNPSSAMIKTTTKLPNGGGGTSTSFTRVPYVPAVMYAARLHPTNVNRKMIPEVIDTPNGSYVPSASERELFADSTPSDGNHPEKFTPLPQGSIISSYAAGNPASLRPNHQSGPGVATGGNILFLDGHVSFRRIERMTLRTIDNGGDNACFWY